MLGTLPYTTVVLIKQMSIACIVVSGIVFFAAYAVVQKKPTIIMPVVVSGWLFGAIGFAGTVVVQPDRINIALAVMFVIATANHARRLVRRARKTLDNHEGDAA